MVTQQYVYGIALNDLWTLDDRRLGILVAQLNDGLLDERKFYHTDVLGSVYALSNETGQILVGFQYDAYGVPTEFGQGLGGLVTFGSNVVTVGTTVPANPYLFAGMRFDQETGRDYDNERYYDPDTGRFSSRDPIGFATGDNNLYRYVRNNPSNYSDPSGLGNAAANYLCFNPAFDVCHGRCTCTCLPVRIRNIPVGIQMLIEMIPCCAASCTLCPSNPAQSQAMSLCMTAAMSASTSALYATVAVCRCTCT